MASVTVTVRARAGGPVLAQASAGVGGCDFLTYTMPGQQPQGLGGGAAGNNLFTQLDHLLGQHRRYRNGPGGPAGPPS